MHQVAKKMAKILKSLIPYRGPITENLIEFIASGLRRNKNCTIIIDSTSGRQWTGIELESVTARIAKHLQKECGLKKGDTCTLYGPSDDRFAILILAVICAGGVSNFLTQKSRGREVLDTSVALKTKFLISTNQLLHDIHSDLSTIDDKIQAISCDKPCDDYRNKCKLIPKECFDNTGLESDTFTLSTDTVEINPDHDFAVIQFSSGTTGKPKPIPRTHKNLCHLVASVDHEELMDLKPGVVITGSLPITHRPGLWALLASIAGGSTFVLWGNLSDVEDALSIIQRYRVNIFSSSLPFLSMLGNTGIRNKSKYDLSSLKHIITSGAKIILSDLPKLLVEEFKLLSLRQCFGMTESGWVFLIESSNAEDNYLSVGHVVPSMEAVVLDRETLKPVEVDVPGEIALRGPQIFPGYLTGEINKFNRSDFTEDGWFRTGDQGYYDKDELIYIEGRYKELLIFENSGRFFPNEIEAVINEHPAIECACVVKVGEFKQAHSYDIARAYVTLKYGHNVSEKELIDFVTSKNFEITLEGGLRILDKFPRLQNGKIDKQHLKTLK